MNRHREHRGHRGYNDFSAPSVPSVVNSVHPFETGISGVALVPHRLHLSRPSRVLIPAPRSFAKSRLCLISQTGEQRFHMLPRLPRARAIGRLDAFHPHTPRFFKPFLFDQRGAE